MTNVGWDLGLRGKGKSAEDKNLSRRFLIWVYAKYVCNCHTNVW